MAEKKSQEGGEESWEDVGKSSQMVARNRRTTSKSSKVSVPAIRSKHAMETRRRYTIKNGQWYRLPLEILHMVRQHLHSRLVSLYLCPSGPT